MYLTVKDSHNTTSVASPVRNAIDDLFNGIEVESIPVVEPMTTSIYRTKTFWKNREEIDTHKVSFEMMMCFNRHLNELMDKHTNPQEEYIQFRIPKKTHGFREINAPKEELKKDMSSIAMGFTTYLSVLNHDSAWAYTSGRDVVGAMKEHTGNKSRWYLKLDLHDFFGSCNPEFIVKQVMNVYPFGFYDTATTKETIERLAQFATLNGGLPQGTPLSPILTNIIMVEYDYKINKLLYKLTKESGLLKQKYIYTRYADDIIISAKNKFDYKIIVEAIKELFNDTPLVLNEEKTRFGSSSGRNWNLGVMCNKDNEITIGYKRKHQLKSIVHNYICDLDNNIEWTVQDLQWLLGNLSWLRNVEPEYFNGLMNYYTNKYNLDVWQRIIRSLKYHS